MREHLDPTDRKLVKLLSQDAQTGVNSLAEKMAVSAPTVRSRLRNLLDRNLIKIVGQLNLTERPELISAIVGVNAQGRGHVLEIARRIADLPFVNSASVVTGRFDIIVDVTVAGDVADLYRITSELIPGVGEPGEIVRSETFVVMASCNRWVSLPEGCWSDSVAPARNEPASVAPARNEPASVAPARNEPASVGPARNEPASVAPARNEPASVAPARNEPASVAPAARQEPA